jgi:MtrB/PioB family decaheme-associated outer membrane protein
MSNDQKRFTMRAPMAAVQGALIALAMVPSTYAAETPAAEPTAAKSAAEPTAAKSAAEPTAAKSAAEPTVAELTKPTSHIELGIGYVSEDSAKAGEYNGLNDQGAYGIANIDVRGGAAYDSDSALRWRINGTNLGLENRNLNAEIGNQGQFRINFGYDELRRERSDSYQTPYQGAGSNTLTLPSNWIKPIVPQSNATALNFRALDLTAGTATGLLGAPTAGNLTTLSNIRNADLPAFHNVNLYTKREKFDGGFSYNLDSQWEFKASASHEEKTGLKPMSTVSSLKTEFAAVIPDLIDQDTDQYNASLNFTGEKGFLQAAYYGSLFRNHVNSMTWEDVNNPLGNNDSVTMSSAPDNQFHQFGLTGGYNFTPSTKLVMKASYARNTQDEAFLTGNIIGANNNLPLGLPRNSLDGLVVTKAFDLKLTAKPITGLNLAGAYKYDDRDNRTPVSTYFFQDANEPTNFPGTPNFFLAGQGANLNMYANRAYSKRVNQINLDADYNLTGSHWLKGGIDWQKIERNCSGSWIDCADADTTKETTGRIEWRGNMAEALAGKVGYAYAHRTVNYNENAFLALVPYANVIPTLGGGAGATMSAYQYMLANNLTGFGPLAGFAVTAGNANIFFPSNNRLAQAAYGSRNNINELLGLRRFNMSDRDRNKLRTSVDWQANDKLSFQGGFDFGYDNYDAKFGLQDSRTWALNLDGTYAVSEDFSTSIFFNHEDMRSRMASDAYGTNSNTGSAIAGSVIGGCYNNVLAKNNNAKLDQCLVWSTDMTDRVDTLGFSFNRKNLLASKLDLGGDLVFSRARTMIDVNGGSYVTGIPPATATAGPVFFIPASNFPTVRTDTVELRLNGKYKINKPSAVNLGYAYQHMKVTDYAYDGMQFGTLTVVTPTNEKAPSFNVHTVWASYIYNF